MGEGKCCFSFSERVCQFNIGESSMTGKPTGSLELRQRKGIRRGPKYPLLKFSSPTTRRFIVVVQFLLFYPVVGRNGEANSPKGPTVRSPPNRLLSSSLEST